MQRESRATITTALGTLFEINSRQVEGKTLYKGFEENEILKCIHGASINPSVSVRGPRD